MVIEVNNFVIRYFSKFKFSIINYLTLTQFDRLL